MGRGDPRHKQDPESGRRKFTDEFKVGEYVSITRHEHGWLDGSVSGQLIRVETYWAVVKGEDGFDYEIAHCRDINKTCPPHQRGRRSR